MKKLLTFMLVLLVLISNIKVIGQSYVRKAVARDADKVVDKSVDAITKIYDDGTKIVNTAYDAAKIVEPKIEKALESIGTSLKIGADKVWDILVKQQLVWSICYLLLTLTSISSWCHVYYRFERAEKDLIERTTKKNSYSNEIISFMGWKDSNTAMFVISLIISIILSSFSMYNFTDMLTGFMNPEFGAMKTIATIASQIK